VTRIETPARTESNEPVVAYSLATGLEACERLLSVEGLPHEVDVRTRRRMADLAPFLKEIAPGATFRSVQAPQPTGWAAIGASIAADANGSPRMLVESARHQKGSRRSPGPAAQNGTLRTRNTWVEFTPDYRPRAVRVIEERDATSKSKTRVAEFHHGRPFADRRGWWVLAAAGAADPVGGRARLLARVDGARLQESAVLAPAEPDTGEAWLPLADPDDAALTIVASIAPTVVLRYDGASRTIEPVARHEAPFIASRLRGGSQVVRFDGGYLCLASESVETEAGSCRTVHRWLWFDPDWRLARLSGPLVMRQRGQETVCGLARVGEDLVVSVVEPGGIGVISVPAAQIAGVLVPPLTLDLEAIERQLEDDPALLTPPEPARGAALPQILRGAAPTIVSMTMTGNNRDIIGDALRSVVDWVDCCLLIDTGITDDTIEVARSVVGDKLVVREFPWRNDFSAARNFSLVSAAETGADWAVTIDSDERLILNGIDIRAVLAETGERSLLVPHLSGTYTKDRFFRLPADGEFRGPTHEAFYLADVSGGATVTVQNVVFDELIKSPEQFRFKDERDRDILREYVQVNPNEPRWFFYLGDVLQRLGQHEEAIAAFRACNALRGWNEESAWAMYRAAESYVALSQLEEALECVVIGMTRHVGLGDMHWFAAYLSLRLGRPEQAVFWARQAIALGNFQGIGKSLRRICWRYPWGLWEGPYDILRFAYRQLGMNDEADEAERLFHRAAEARKAQPANV
jgi:glycosyltransferase involved in cell wall biosynthesis